MVVTDKAKRVSQGPPKSPKKQGGKRKRGERRRASQGKNVSSGSEGNQESMKRQKGGRGTKHGGSREGRLSHNPE